MTVADTKIGVRVDGVSKRYMHRVKGEHYAARDVRIDVAPGEFLTLLGPSGCGKTTTLRIIAGFEQPDAGRIYFGQQDVTRLAANRRDIGFVFQNYALFPHLSVAGNVSYGLAVRGQSQATIAKAVGDVLSLVGLAGYDRQFPGQLSGGEQQRVALARAIVIRPRVLLFDEPLSNLDAKLRVSMRQEIRDLQQRLAITTIYVTHDQEEAMAVSDRIAVMNEGSVVQDGSARDLYHRPATEFVARFVGRVNFIPARVVAMEGDTVLVDALGAMLRTQPGAQRFVAGETVSLLLRPEAIVMDRDAGAGPLSATVVSHAFLGEKIEYLVSCNGMTLQIVRHNAGSEEIVADGTAVSLRPAPDAATLLKEAPR